VTLGKEFEAVMVNAAEKSSIDPELAWKSLFGDREWGKKVSVGATFNALSIILLLTNPLLLPIVFIFWALVCGYLHKVIHAKIADPNAPLPPWKDWLELVISGLTWLAVATGFFFFIISIPTVSLLFGAAKGVANIDSKNFILWAVSTFTLTFVMWMFVSIINMFLQANFAQEERANAALALFKVLQRLREDGGAMLQAWLLSIGLLTLAIVAPACTVIGVFLMPTTVFIASILSAVLAAQAWSPSPSR
jgi:hypothetical protein